MNDERQDRLEQELRAWLSTEARRATPPQGLRQRVAEVRGTTAHRVGFRGWFLRPFALTGAMVALALLVVLTVALGGFLPAGRPDCSEVTIERVRTAVADLPGYRWHLTGTELLAYPAFDTTASPPSVSYTYTTAAVEFIGRYDAPDSWALEELRGYDASTYRQPSVGLVIQPGWDAYLVTGGQAWARPRGGTHYQPITEPNNTVQLREANQLSGLLVGLPFRIVPPGVEPAEVSLSWATSSEPGGCRLTARNNDLDHAPGASPDLIGARWSLEVLVNPKTLLPVEAEYAEESDETPLEDGASSPRSDLQLSFTYDYEDPPVISAPIPAGFRPVDPQQAIADARELGVGEAPTMDQYQLDTAQAFLLDGPRATAALLYVDGRLQQSATVQSDLDVWITLLASGEPDPATFLVAVINDPRVAYVEVSFTDGATRTITGAGVHPQSVTSGEGLGEIVTWTAYDDAGNELSVEPPPP